MDKALFERLTHSMAQMNEIIEGTRQPSRTFEVDAMKIKEIRRASGLSQSKFAELISVSVDTLRNWEQGRRSARLRVIVKLLSRRHYAAFIGVLNAGAFCMA